MPEDDDGFSAGHVAVPLNAARLQTIKQRLFSSDATGCHRRCLGEKFERASQHGDAMHTVLQPSARSVREQNMTAFTRREAVA